MQKPQRRVKLLRRLSRMREVEKRQAALRMAEAEGAHGKLRALGERSGEIAASYAGRADAGDGGELARHLRFRSGLQTIQQETESERRKAEESTQQALGQLLAAERKHEVTNDRLASEKRAAERMLQTREASSNPVLARKLKGRG